MTEIISMVDLNYSSLLNTHLSVSLLLFMSIKKCTNYVDFLKVKKKSLLQYSIHSSCLARPYSLIFYRSRKATHLINLCSIEGYVKFSCQMFSFFQCVPPCSHYLESTCFQDGYKALDSSCSSKYTNTRKHLSHCFISTVLIVLSNFNECTVLLQHNQIHSSSCKQTGKGINMHNEQINIINNKIL